MEFQSFHKIKRLDREIIITEKIDGTNAQVCVVKGTTAKDFGGTATVILNPSPEDNYALYAGSRNRWITPEDDNFGFAAWVKENAEELVNLGPGRHYGEWWGKGIQRGYGLSDRRFSLFNTERWNNAPLVPCCSVVPVLYRGQFRTELVDVWLDALRRIGSFAADGYMNPEGVVVYHTAANVSFKKTLDDEGHKSSVETSDGALYSAVSRLESQEDYNALVRDVLREIV